MIYTRKISGKPILWAAVALTVLLMVRIVLASPNMQIPPATTTTWYVSTTGSDSDENGGIKRPFHTIQYAIDAASSGDSVVVLEGRYTGPGNTGLNLRGKAITVRSQAPKDDACRQKTIIDAQRQGVIVRFVNDEGPDSIFEGFSLVAGDTSNPIQGIPGFFELSRHAEPTMRYLHIVGDGPAPSELPDSPAAVSTPAAASTPYGTLVWDGHNPFHHPAATTDYYGSGDADNDGSLTDDDILMAQEMAMGTKQPSARADVDGNGVVNATDIALINGALSGSTLPAWWDQLSGQAARNAWVDKFLALDRTDEHIYEPSWFVCSDFAIQMYINGAFYRGDLSLTEYSGGPTRFNLPLYDVVVTGPSYGHGINAILVGNDPLNFDDWRFLEPQTDQDVYPGMWDMPYNTTVRIWSLELISNGAIWKAGEQVVFSVDETGWTLEEYNPDLRLTRPDPEARTPDNRPDLWNPRILPIGSGKVLYERSRDDLSHMTDIHLADLPFSDPPDGTPLTLASEYSRLLDVFSSPDGTIHMLWTGKPEYIPGVFYGQLDPATQTLSNVSRVSDQSRRQVFMGRVVVAQGEVHVFWLEGQTNVFHPHPPGIYWTRWTGSGWAPAQNLAPDLNILLGTPSWQLDHEIVPYAFDVAAYVNGELALVWAEPVPDYSWYRYVRQRVYHNDVWEEMTTVVDASPVRGVELQVDASEILHLAYWVEPSYMGAHRGNVLHRTHDGLAWSEPYTLDASGNAGYPRMAADKDGVYLVWERRIDDQVVPVWSKYTEGVWSTPQVLQVRAGAEAWYPTVDLLPDGTIVFAWSSRAFDRTTVETFTIPLPLFLNKQATPQDGLLNTDVLTYTLTISGTDMSVRLWDPLPANVTYVTGSLTSTITPAPVYSPTAHAITWEGTLPAEGTVTIYFQVTPDTTGAPLNPAPPIVNTAWLTDVIYDRSISSTCIVNPKRTYLPLIAR